MDPTRLPRKFLTARVAWWTALYTTKLIHRDTSAYSPKYSRQRHHRFMAAPCAECTVNSGKHSGLNG
jgi:hypothetical protein